MSDLVPLLGFPSYAVTREGEVVNVRRDSLVRPRYNQQGILMVGLVNDDGRLTTRSVAVLVAETFIEKPSDRFNVPIHFDGDRANCHVDNLDWRPRPLATKYHQQFSVDFFHESNEPLLLQETGEEFRGLKPPAIRYGLYYINIILSYLNQEPAFPSRYHFVRLD